MLVYLFERFPTFTQTFCAREVSSLRQAGLPLPAFSIRSCADEPVKSFAPELYAETVCLPQDMDAAAKRWWSPFAWRARAARRQLVAAWGPEGDRARAHEAAWLAPKLRALGATHVHVHFAGRAARAAFWVQRLCGIPFSFTAHANDVFVNDPVARLGDLFREARFVVTVSDFSARGLRERFPAAADRIHRVYNGIDCAAYRVERRPDTPPLILAVGRYISKKGYDDLIEACAALGSRPFQCRLVGEGPLEGALREQIRRLGLEDKVIVEGPKSAEEVRALLARASIFALACRADADGGMDNLPTVFMEAMAAGLPVVSTRLAGIPEMVDHETTGLLVPPDTPGDLSAALARLLDDPAAVRAMGAAGETKARALFDQKATTASLLDVFARHGVAVS